MGTGATLAWFSDTDTVRNAFQVGLLKLNVSYRNDIVTEYTPLQGTTKAFNDEALYEPGYTQVVYLKIENAGDVDFQYKVAVTVEGFTNGKNMWGEDIYLSNYLRNGVVFGETEAEVQKQVKDRLAARTPAPNEWGALGTWLKISPYTFETGGVCPLSWNVSWFAPANAAALTGDTLTVSEEVEVTGETTTAGTTEPSTTGGST